MTRRALLGWESVHRAGIVAIGVLLLAACTDRADPVAEPQSVRPARILEVTVSPDSRKLSFVGRIEAAKSIDLAFEVSGPLQQLPVREGQTVERGALVAALDPTEFQLAVREAEVQLKLARQDLQRKERILKQRAIARSDVDDARSFFELQRVRLERARETLRDTRLISPFDALVARRYVDSFVNVRAADPIVRLHDLHELLVVANIPEHLFATVSATDVTDTYCQFEFAPSRRFPLTVRENRTEADSVAQTYEVSFAMDRPADLNLLPGMTTTVFVELSNGVDHRILLPPAAVIGAPDGSMFVWVLANEEGDVERRSVRVGAPGRDGVPVIEGLQAGDRVVTTGAERLQDGMRVRPLEH